MALDYNENALIPATVGMVRFKGLDVSFTSASEINKTHAFGDPVVDAVTNQPVRLPGRPSYNPMTVTTPFTPAAQKKIKAWLKTKEAQTGNVALTLIIQGFNYSFTKCSLSQTPVSPGFDANANQTTASFLTLIVEVTSTSIVEILNTSSASA